MAIQVRRGLKKDFDPYKMLPGEWAVSIDNQTQNQIVWMCFQAGVVKRMGTYEDFVDQVKDATVDVRDQYIAEFDVIKDYIEQLANTTQQNTDTVIQISNSITEIYLPRIQAYIESAEQSAKLAESHNHGNTGVRLGEDTDNSKYWSEQSKIEADRAKIEADRAKIEADKAARYSDITAPDFYLDLDDMTLYMKSGIGVDFILDEDDVLYWSVA